MAGCSRASPTCWKRCPSTTPTASRIEKLFREMAEKLKSIQKADGYWAPSLLGPENSPAESSGTGFYVYGLAWGVKHELLDAAEYRPAMDKGWAALKRAVAKDGKLGWVQQVSDRPENVKAEPTHSSTESAHSCWRPARSRRWR